MTEWLRQSTAATGIIGPFVASGDGYTPQTSLTIARANVRLSKNGGDMAQKNEATSCTHDEVGMYFCPLDATDTNTVGRLKLVTSGLAAALPLWQDFMVVPSAVYDSLFGTAPLSVNVSGIAGAVPSAAILASVVDDTTRIDASALNTLSGHDPGAAIAKAGDAMTLTAAYDAAKTAASQTTVNDIPTNAEFNARTIPSANYVTSGSIIAGVTTVANVSGNVSGSVGSVATEVSGNVVKISGAAVNAATAQLGVNVVNWKGSAASEFSAAYTATEKAAIDLLDDADGGLADVHTVVNGINTTIGSSGAGLNSIPWNANWDAEVESECTDALNTYDPPTKSELDTAIDAIPTTGEIKAAIEIAGGSVAQILADTNELQINQTGWATATGFAVSGDIPTTGQIRDTIWQAPATGYNGTGTMGRIVNLLRKLRHNKSVDSGTSIEYFDDNNTDSLGTESWDDGTGTRGKNTVTW